MKGVVQNDGRHDPCQPDWHRHSHEDPDVLRLPVVVAEVPGLDGQAAHEQDEEDLEITRASLSPKFQPRRGSSVDRASFKVLSS